jgi:hypothetical protein
MSVVIHLPFSEDIDTVLPSDVAGGLEDLNGDPDGTPALVLPAVVDTPVGLARQFGDNIGLIGTEAIAGATKLVQDLTIEVVLSLDLGELADPAVVVQRGDGSSAAERILWGLTITPDTATHAIAALRWEVDGGVEAAVPGVSFRVPSGPFYLWAVRRWVSREEVEVRYGIGDVDFGSAIATDGEIEDGVGGTTLVGCSRVGTAYDSFLPGAIAALRVRDSETSYEELRQVYRAIAVHGPDGYEAQRQLVPPRVYSTDPDSIVQRELQVEGGSLGGVAGELAETVENGLPDRASGEMLERWEKVEDLSPRPRDSIATRRKRAAGRWASIHGFNVDKIREAVAPLLDCDAEDLEIIEGTNRYTDDFADLSPNWFEHEGAGSIAASGELELDAQSSVAEWPFDAVYVARSIDMVPSRDDGHVGSYVKATLAGVDDFGGSVDAMAGLLLFDTFTDEALLFGYDTPTQLRLFSYDPDTAAWSVEHTFASTDALPRVLHLRCDDGAITFATADPADPDVFEESHEHVTAFAPNWFGLAIVVADPDAGAPAAQFDDAAWLMRQGEAPFYWFLYRDPALGGSPDLRGARELIERVGPAHCLGAIAESDAAITDDAEPGFGVPIGD